MDVEQLVNVASSVFNFLSTLQLVNCLGVISISVTVFLFIRCAGAVVRY